MLERNLGNIGAILSKTTDRVYIYYYNILLLTYQIQYIQYDNRLYLLIHNFICGFSWREIPLSLCHHQL